MNYDIVDAFRQYAENPARWFNNYQEQCSPLTDIPRDELTDGEFEAAKEANKNGTLKIKIHL